MRYRARVPPMTLLHPDPYPFPADKPPAKPWSDDELERDAELRADGELPFPVDRRAVRDVVQDRLGVRIERVSFLSAGTFHKVRPRPCPRVRRSPPRRSFSSI